MSSHAALVSSCICIAFASIVCSPIHLLVFRSSYICFQHSASKLT
jgi:hypothetical protein